MTLPRRSFVFKEFLFSFDSENEFAVHLEPQSFPGFWPRLRQFPKLIGVRARIAAMPSREAVTPLTE
jgi:hypothetical protein